MSYASYITYIISVLITGNLNNLLIYSGLLTNPGHLKPTQIRKLVEDNFNAWGPIKRLYMVPLKTLAFVE